MDSGWNDEGGGAGIESPSTETARYIADVAAGIAMLARKAGLEALAHILEMARLEAEETAQKTEPQ